MYNYDIKLQQKRAARVEQGYVPGYKQRMIGLACLMAAGVGTLLTTEQPPEAPPTQEIVVDSTP